MMIDLEELLNSEATTSVAPSIGITAIVDSALCVGAGGSTGTLADKAIVRNADGRLLIPASQVKGRLRHECEKLARGLGWDICHSPTAGTMCPQRAGVPGHFVRDEYRVEGYKEEKSYHCLICQMFGNPVLESAILFDDLICTEEPDNLSEVLRPGVTINRVRRTAEEQKLYFLETSPANAQLRFKGSIHWQPNLEPERLNYAKILIWIGLNHIHALGGSKSAGLGWLRWEKLDNFEVDAAAAWQFLAKGEAK